MEYEDVLALYKKLKSKYGSNAYKHITELFAQIKDHYESEYLRSPRARKKIAQGKTVEPGQSWRSFEGHTLEKLILEVINDAVEQLDLRIVRGDVLDADAKELSEELRPVKENIQIDYEELGKFVPDADLVIYRPSDGRIIAIVSSKASLRERIAQTAYWKKKFEKEERLSHIKALFVSLDKDGTLTSRKNPSKGRAIVEKDTDGGYVMSLEAVEESDRVKTFDKFITDLKTFLD